MKKIILSLLSLCMAWSVASQVVVDPAIMPSMPPVNPQYTYSSDLVFIQKWMYLVNTVDNIEGHAESYVNEHYAWDNNVDGGIFTRTSWDYPDDGETLQTDIDTMTTGTPKSGYQTRRTSSSGMGTTYREHAKVILVKRLWSTQTFGGVNDGPDHYRVDVYYKFYNTSASPPAWQNGQDPIELHFQWMGKGSTRDLMPPTLQKMPSLPDGNPKQFEITSVQIYANGWPQGEWTSVPVTLKLNSIYKP